MQCGTWRGYFSNEAGAEEQVRDHLRSTTWIRQSSVEEWDNKIADMEERYEVAKRFAAATMDFAEKSQDHAKNLGWMKEYFRLVRNIRLPEVQQFGLPRLGLRSTWPKQESPKIRHT